MLLCALVFGAIAADTTFALSAKRLSKPPRIDGVVDSAEWAGSAAARSFIQYAPRRGVPVDQETHVLVAYDSTHLYIAFRVFDDEAPTAQLTRRDASLFEDDAVIVMLDTYHDRQSGYYFMTNLRGTQSDGRIADDGRTIDGSWDASWRHAVRSGRCDLSQGNDRLLTDCQRAAIPSRDRRTS
jgi:hypothetical protein